MQGWIKLHRKFKNWEWWDDEKMVKLFLYLLLSANFEDKKWQGITIKRGQLVTSLKHISTETNFSVQTIRTLIKRLKSTHELTSKTTNKYTTITVCKYDSYQELETPANTVNNTPTNKQLTNKQQTNNKQLTTTKECKELKELNKEKKIQKKETPQPPRGEHVFSDDEIKKAEKLYIQKIGKSQLQLLQNSEIAKSLSLRKKRILSDWLQHKKEIKSQIKTQRGMDGLCKKFKGHSEKVLFELVKFSAEDNNYKGLIWKKADEFAEKVEKGKKEKRMYPTFDKVNARDNDPEYIKECLRIHREKQEEDLARFAKRVKVDYWAP